MTKVTHMKITVDEAQELRALLEWANQQYHDKLQSAFTTEEETAISKHIKRLEYAYTKILNYNRICS